MPQPDSRFLFSSAVSSLCHSLALVTESLQLPVLCQTLLNSHHIIMVTVSVSPSECYIGTESNAPPPLLDLAFAIP
jgi:hypothetical protein